MSAAKHCDADVTDGLVDVRGKNILSASTLRNQVNPVLFLETDHLMWMHFPQKQGQLVMVQSNVVHQHVQIRCA